MKLFYLLICIGILFLLNTCLYGYNKIAVQTDTVVSFYDDLPAAVTAASPGSILYLCGATFTGCTINKKLTIIGAGHYPAGTTATGKTIVGNLVFSPGSDSTKLIGLSGGAVTFGNAANQKFSYITISRCYFGYISCYNQTTDTLNSCYFDESVFEGLGSSNAVYQYLEITKSIIYGLPASLCSFSNLKYSLMKNSIVLCLPYSNLFTSTCSNNLIANNVINCNNGTLGNDNIYSNNIFTNNFSFPSGTNMGNNNIMNQSLTNTFEIYSNSGFNYSNNYHLKSTSPGKNAGTDGFDIGIYGTSVPYKENAIPYNPHFNSATVPVQSVNGALQINMQIEAQTR